MSQPRGTHPGDRTVTGILGIESVTYGVADVAQSTRFFEDFGLVALERGASGATFGTPEQTTVLVRDAEDASLPSAVEPGPTVREIVWGVDALESLDALGADLEGDYPVTRDADGTVWTVDPAGFATGFRVTGRVPVKVKSQTLNTISEALRRNQRFELFEQAAPHHMGHIVLYCPDFEASWDFYVERLGFMVSDLLDGAGAFLRCSTDHHNLFLLRYHRAGLNHVSFGVQNIDEIMGGYKMMSESGWEPSWGLGRHYIGSNIFYYFRNPSGGHVEYYADMDCITNPELWTPETFDAGAPEALFAWGGYPPPDYRKSQWELDAEAKQQALAELPAE